MHIDLVLISKYCVFIFTTMHQYSLIVKICILRFIQRIQNSHLSQHFDYFLFLSQLTIFNFKKLT